MKTSILQMKKLAVASLCIVSLMASGCGKQSLESVDQSEEQVEFCACLNAENMDATLPVVNKFLSALPNALEGEEKLEILATWLKAHPCITDASVVSQTRAQTGAITRKIGFAFDENGESVELILGVSMETPLKATGYHEWVEEETEEPEVPVDSDQPEEPETPEVSDELETPKGSDEPKEPEVIEVPDLPKEWVGGLFYYYGYEKIYLTQVTDKICLKFASGYSKQQLLSFISSDASLQSTSSTYLEDGSLRFAVLETKDGNEITKSTIDFFKGKDEVVSVEYLFQWNVGKFLGITDEFVVRLKETTSYGQLQELARKNLCTIGAENQFVKNKYKLYVSKNSNFNAMQMSCLFFDTGFFEYSEPNPIFFNVFD